MLLRNTARPSRFAPSKVKQGTVLAANAHHAEADMREVARQLSGAFKPSGY